MTALASLIGSLRLNDQFDLSQEIQTISGAIVSDRRPDRENLLGGNRDRKNPWLSSDETGGYLSHLKLLQISLKGNKAVLVKKNLSVVLREKGGMIEENLSKTRNPHRLAPIFPRGFRR
jgi:hypothetical protein